MEEDAAVYRIDASTAVIQTADVITPVLNDPYSFGAVAAANALSDIYAMGGNPVFALNLLEFPIKSLPMSILEAILQGGQAKAGEDGVNIAGGHSLEDNAPKYGLAVTGLGKPYELVSKKGASAGDMLILTKPIGTGVVTTALDREICDTNLENEVYRVMATLNKSASEAMMEIGANACTDITGFGLMGHLTEMLAANRVSARIYANEVPIIPNAREMVEKGAVPAGTHHNLRYLENKVSWKNESNQEEKMLLCDPQTSGGLLIAVAKNKAKKLQQKLREKECLASAIIGEIIEEEESKILLE